MVVKWIVTSQTTASIDEQDLQASGVDTDEDKQPHLQWKLKRVMSVGEKMS